MSEQNMPERDPDYVCEDYGDVKAWTQIRVTVPLEQLDTLTALMSMISNNLMIEDYSDIETNLRTCYGDLIDEKILNADRTVASVSVYVPSDRSYADDVAFLRDRMAADGLNGKLELVGVNEEDWANNWKQYFKPFTVGERLLIKPSWEMCENPWNRAVLEIDPASSFGTGQHHTTRLCLELLEQLMHPGDRVLDLGCGSGILSIGALLLGASGATAVDIEENAAATATENARKNHIDPTLYRVFCGNVLEDETLCREIGDGYDLICANIVADVLIAMKQLFRQFLRPEGSLIMSGIIMERRDEVLDQLKKAGFALLEVREKEGWAAASLRIS